MNKLSLYATLILAGLAVFPAGAYADWHDHNSGHSGYHGYHQPRTYIGFGIVPRPVYYHPVRTYYYTQAPQVVYVQPPVQYVQVAAANEPYCHEFTRTIYIGGRATQGYGNACLQPDGSWQFED